MNLTDIPVQWLMEARLIIDRKHLEKMEQGGPPEIDAFLRREIQLLKKEYFQMGHPRIIYLAGSTIAKMISPLKGSQSSFQFAHLHGLLAEMILAQGTNAYYLNIALEHLELAFEVLNRVQVVNDDIIQGFVFNSLLLSVTKKALGNLDESIRYTRKIADFLKSTKSATELDLIPLRRQEIMMGQTVKGHRRLAEAAVRYSNFQPKEYFRSLKRIFEFLLNKGRFQEAGRIYPELKRAFYTVSYQLAPIAHISFMKNIGQYLIAKNETISASRILKETLDNARQRGLHGQIRQVNFLIQDLEAGIQHGNLVTFQAE